MSEQVVLYIVGVLITIILSAVGYVLKDVKDALKSVKEDSAVSISEALERIRILELQYQSLITEHNAFTRRASPPLTSILNRDDEWFSHRARDGDAG